jgi:hypothetical protein
MCTVTTTQSQSSTDETDDVVTYAQGPLTYVPRVQLPDQKLWRQPYFAGSLNQSFSDRTAVAFKLDFQIIPFLRSSTYLFDPNNTDSIVLSILSGGTTPTEFPPPVYSIDIRDVTTDEGDMLTNLQYSTQVIYGALDITKNVVTVALGAQSSS